MQVPVGNMKGGRNNKRFIFQMRKALRKCGKTR